MRPSGPPTEQEILKIARRTTDIIESNITSNVCLFGSAACYLWADIGRVPNVRSFHSHSIYLFLFRLIEMVVFNSQDIDIVVSVKSRGGVDPEDIAEYIKRTIKGADNRYFLVQTKKPDETYHKLYCRLTGWVNYKRCVKVDILVPPTQNLPTIRASERRHIEDIPVMPIFDLLVMKTQGWQDHRISPRADFRAKVEADVSDIFALLKCAKFERVSCVNEAKKFRHSQEFMSYACTLVNEFVFIHGRPKQWRAIGFPVMSHGKWS
jgi:hypothetical protein